jgi:hypothetical protein
MARPRVADGGDCLRVSSRGLPTRGGPPAWGLGEGLTTHRKNSLLRRVSELAGCCERGNELSDPIKGREFLD